MDCYIFPESFEKKIGFDGIRPQLQKLCMTIPGRQMADDMSFTSDAGLVARRLDSTSQMLDVVTSHEALPLAELGDVAAILASIRVAGARGRVERGGSEPASPMGTARYGRRSDRTSTSSYRSYAV